MSDGRIGSLLCSLTLPTALGSSAETALRCLPISEYSAGECLSDIAISKREAFVRLQQSGLPETLSHMLGGLLQDSRISDPEVFQRSSRQVSRVLELGSANPAANSYFEYASYTIFEQTLLSGRVGHFDQLFVLLSTPHTWADLRDFAEETRIDLGLMKHRRHDHLLDAASRNEPLEKSYLRAKMTELENVESGDLDHPSAFVDGDGLARTIAEFWNVVRGGEDPRFKKMERRLGPDGDLDCEVVDQDTIQTVVLKRAAGRAVFSSAVEAIYQPGWETGGKPKLLLLRLPPRDLKANQYHEYIHIEQLEQHGLRWLYDHFLPSEMEAFAGEIALRLSMGDDELYQSFASLSPYGIFMGLRVGIEQLYHRHRPLPRS